jgi:FkbM family methyltransferase
MITQQRDLENRLRAVAHVVTGEPEYRIVSRLCDPDALAIDVGVADGGYLQILSKSAKACIGFEPNRQSFSLLKPRFPEIQIEPCALSDQAGEVELRVPIAPRVQYVGYGTIEAANPLADAASDAIASYSVPLRTLDSYEFEDVGFIKIDVEGHELSVVRGGVGTITRSRPNMLIEIEERHREGNIAAISTFLVTLGYQLFFLRGKFLRPIEQFSAERDQRIENILKPGRYVNNFVCLSNPAAFQSMIQS